MLPSLVRYADRHASQPLNPVMDRCALLASPSSMTALLPPAQMIHMRTVSTVQDADGVMVPSRAAGHCRGREVLGSLDLR